MRLESWVAINEANIRSALAPKEEPKPFTLQVLKDLVNVEISNQSADRAEEIYFNGYKDSRLSHYYASARVKVSLTTAEAIAYFELENSLWAELAYIFSCYRKSKARSTATPPVGNYKSAPKGFAIYYISLLKSVRNPTRAFKQQAALYALLSVRDKESNIRFKLHADTKEIERLAKRLRLCKPRKAQEILASTALTLSDIWNNRSNREIVNDRFCEATLNRELYLPETFAEKKARVAG